MPTAAARAGALQAREALEQPRRILGAISGPPLAQRSVVVPASCAVTISIQPSRSL